MTTMRSKIIFGIVVILALSALSLASINLVSAETISAWIQAGPIDKTLLEEGVTSNIGDKFCTKSSEKVLAYSLVNGVMKQGGYSPVENNCWTATSYGSFGSGQSGSYMRVGNIGAVTAFESNRQYLPIPNSPRLLMTYNNGTSFFQGVSIIENVKDAFILQQSGLSDKYVLNTSGSGLFYSLINPTTNQPLNIGAISASSNGKWLIIETSGPFLRYNLETKQFLAFEQPLFLYGYGTNPHYELAISDDGRYAVVGGGPYDSKVANIYDLATCVPVANQPLAPATGCGKRNLKADVFPFLTSSQSPSRFIFSGASSEYITLDVPENKKINRYVIYTLGSNQHMLEYLALGDSFSSGEGDGNGSQYYKPGTDGNGEAINNTGIADFPYAKEKCHISTRSYSYLLASSANISANLFSSIACSGAVTEDVISNDKLYIGQHKQFASIINDSDKLIQIKQTALDNFFPGRESQIKFLEKYKPRVATIGIGGNDIGFADKLTACVTSVASTCEYASNNVTASINRQTTALEISNLYGKLKDLYTKLRMASPTTRLYAVGYPQLVTIGGSCGFNVQLDLQEQEYAVFTVNYLDRTIKAAASAAGINYLDVEDSLAGTNLCSSWAQPSVNGITKGNDIGLGSVKVIGNESYHPNEKGHALMASEMRADLYGDAINTHDPCAVSLTISCNTDSPTQPAIPAYFGTVGTTPVTAKQYFSTIIDSAKEAVVSLKDDLKSIAVNIDETITPLKSFSNVQFTLHSDPISLGTYTTDANGKLSANITIPDGVTPGYHTVTMRATLPSGDEAEFYQSLLVLASLTDGDGDGIADTADPCPFIVASGIDADHDGIDDACDSYLNPDSVTPVITGTPAQLASIDGWYNQDVTIDWTATDAEPSSGIVALPAATTATLEGTNDYSSAQVCDNANNCATGTVSLKIDKTAPILGAQSWTQNPKPASGTTTMSVSANDVVSGISQAEYFIGETDPGIGHGSTMTVDGNTLSTVFGTDFPTGVYKISVRAKDQAGNWSGTISDYLVVYNPSSNLRISGQQSIVPNLSRGDTLPGLITVNQKDQARFAFNVMYDKHGTISRGSDLHFIYKTGSHCENPKKATNCHYFYLDATSISWLTTQGIDRSSAMFQGTAKLKVDGVSRQVQFRTTVIDGSHLIPRQKDQFELQVFDIDANPNTADHIYQVGSSQIKRGNIIISNFHKCL